MEKIKVKYSLLLFLYAYLRQIDLSLDRSRWGAWSKLQNYFKNRIGPNQIIDYLRRHFHLPETDLAQFVFFLKNKTIVGKLKSSIVKNPFLMEDEVLYCCKLLWKFEKELKSNSEKYSIEIEKLRIDIAEYYTKVLEPKILTRDLDGLMRIEHFEQNDKLEIINLDEYVPDDF